VWKVIQLDKFQKVAETPFMRLLCLLLYALLLQSCQPPPRPLPPVWQSKELVVVTFNSPSTYYVDGQNNFAGLEYDLAKLFTKELGAEFKVKFLLVDNISQVIPALLHGKAHLAAAGLGMTYQKQSMVRFSTPYQNVQQQVVYNRERHEKPASVKDLIGKLLEVPFASDYAGRLAEFSRGLPELHWHEVKNESSDELLEKVAEGTIDYTVADAHLVAVVQNYYPNLATGFDLGPPEQLAWAFPGNGDDLLYQKAQTFFARIRQDGTLHNLMDRYYGHSERLNQTEVSRFLVCMRTVLPRYLRLFKHAQELTGVDWRLLAAISYQESHWDTFNTSPTNVRGLMMLTEDTADKMGVTDRLDPNQSIIAGARYLLTLKDAIPARVPEPDRTWLALASYNIGYAHLEDGRALAQRQKLNPDRWADLKKTLPLLNKYEYYSSVKHGFARGGAPVVFVESVRTYYQILERYEQKHTPVLPSFNLAWLGARTTLTE
jgi:membrane-bound lytic murein transglycosylase F